MSTTDSTKQNLSVMEKIKALRLVYEAEKHSREKSYNEQINSVKASIEKVKNTNYSERYEEKFLVALDSLEKLYNEMAQVHKETQGIDFRIHEHIKKCKPKSVPQGKVEVYFDTLVKECREAVTAVKNSKSIEDDVAPLKVFCQGLADLRFLNQNAKKLISDAKLADRDRKEDLAPLDESLTQLIEERQNALSLKHFDCYDEICNLRNEIIKEHSKLSDDILGSGKTGFDGSYRFLVGFYKNKIPKEDRDFAVKIMNVPADNFERTPIYFHFTPAHDTILIKAPSSFLVTNEYNDFMRNLYFTFASHLPPRDLLFCGIECDPDEAVVGGLGDRIKQMGDTYICHDVEDRGNKLSDSNGTLARLRDISLDNSKKQRSESIHDIFEYNELFPDNPQKFSYFCISNYPAGFNTASSSAIHDMRQLANGGSKGIISVICETTDGVYRDTAPILTAEELHADCIEFDADGNMLYNGMPADCNITAEDFRPRDYWNTLDAYFKSAASISLESLLKSADNATHKPAPIAIPIGKSDGELFNLELTECTDKLYGLIIGTVGSGKSAFLHTLILSAAYNNSPEDLQFYLADFKDGSGSTEFSHYRKMEGVNNLYIPHVRYLLLKGKSESAFDLLEKIESIRSKRAQILTRMGYSQVTDYNNSDEVRRGKEPKLPHLIFVIDEYNAMLNGGNGTDKQSAAGAEIATAIAAKIKNLISTARAYGIGIILCGQSVDSALKNGQALGNMGCRISLPVKNDSELISLFDLDSYDAKKKIQQLAGQGDALVSLGRTSNLRYVRTAYSGKTNGQQQLRIADMIRKKYAGVDYTQVEAGSEDAVSITDTVESDVYYTEQGNDIHLEMGISSANALRIPLVYSSAEASVNYFACTGKEKLCKIERNAMFAFLNATAGMKRSYSHAPVTYLGMKEKMNECLNSYFSAIPWLSSHIDTVTTKTDIAKKLIELRRIYRERKRAVDRGETSKFDPMFVVVRDIAWLNDKEADWLPDFAAEATAKTGESAPASNAKVLDTSAIEAQAKAQEGITFNSDLLARIQKNVAAGAATAPVSKKSSSSERFTVSDVKTALAMLYAQGNKYGIFLLVSSEIYRPIVDILMSETDDRGIALARYGVFGSFQEASTHNTDTSAPKECIFITLSNSKTRLYDYDPDTNKSFWNELKQRL